jgi:16S rRNA (guanine(527)-N(7))-methyltransferase RsmG
MRRAPLLGDLLARHGFPATENGVRALSSYRDLLETWNRKFNLTGSTEWAALAPLFEEAIWAAALYPDEASRHLDLGSGAGFPAVPLRILRPRMELDLVESRERRAVFLETVAGTLGLGAVRVRSERIGSALARDPGARWDRVSWKAIRLDDTDLELLLTRRPRELWIFHGATVPANEALILDAYALTTRDATPGRTDSFLSRYTLR